MINMVDLYLTNKFFRKFDGLFSLNLFNFDFKLCHENNIKNI